MYPQTHIELCPKCKGEEEIKEYLDNEVDFIFITCPTCKGSGRVNVTIKKTIEPFKR